LDFAECLKDNLDLSISIRMVVVYERFVCS
jgi:hypothetical protein